MRQAHRVADRTRCAGAITGMAQIAAAAADACSYLRMTHSVIARMD